MCERMCIWMHICMYACPVHTRLAHRARQDPTYVCVSVYLYGVYMYTCPIYARQAHCARQDPIYECVRVYVSL
jgi:hypothetical protein